MLLADDAMEENTEDTSIAVTPSVSLVSEKTEAGTSSMEDSGDAANKLVTLTWLLKRLGKVAAQESTKTPRESSKVCMTYCSSFTLLSQIVYGMYSFSYLISVLD